MLLHIETTEQKLIQQILRFLNKYPSHAAILLVLASKIIRLNKGALYMEFIIKENNIVQYFAEGYTAYKNRVRHGSATIGILGAAPVMPEYPTIMPELSEDDIEGLFREVLQDCVNSGHLSEEIAADLGILDLGIPEVLEEGTPKLTGKLGTGGHPILHTFIGVYSGYQIWKDIGKGYLLLTVSTTANYTDISALPIMGSGEVWKYKIIYVYKNVPIGNWSNECTISVIGHV